MDAVKATDILKHLIEIQSFSREEDNAVNYLSSEIAAIGYQVERKGNNLIVKSNKWQEGKPVLLLNSHIDTVKPSDKWTKEPFKAQLEGDKLYGLGSNDAGGCLVSLLASFVNLDKREQPFNLLFVVSAEEEISGKNGIASIIKFLPNVDFAVVGEPTQMHMAIAEKGLMVLDCHAYGKSGHAARNEGENAIYRILDDIEWFKTYKFPKVSNVLGEVKMTVTQINAGSQHNVVPDKCSIVVDVRSNELYSNQELHALIAENVRCDVCPRSYRINSSSTPMNHPVVKKGMALGREYYGSPTTSDQALMPFLSVKLGPGNSSRSHTADEYVLLSEIEEGIELYCAILDGLTICL